MKPDFGEAPKCMIEHKPLQLEVCCAAPIAVVQKGEANRDTFGLIGRHVVTRAPNHLLCPRVDYDQCRSTAEKGLRIRFKYLSQAAILSRMPSPYLGRTCYKVQRFKVLERERPELKRPADKHRLRVEERIHLLSLATALPKAANGGGDRKAIRKQRALIRTMKNQRLFPQTANCPIESVSPKGFTQIKSVGPVPAATSHKEKPMQRKLLIGFVAVLVATVVTERWFAKPVLAQVRAAFIQNIDEPGRTSFAFIGTATANSPASMNFTVPVGQRYVVEQYSADCRANATNATLTNVQLTGVANGQPTFTATAPRNVGAVLTAFNNFYYRWVATGQGPIYADPGSTITASASTNDVVSFPAAGIQGCTFYLSGHVIANP